MTGLVEAYEELQKERQLPIELHLVGGGPDEELIRDLVEKKGLLGKGIEIHGRLPNEEVQALIPKMSAVIVNSLFETFSVVTVESLVHGRPVAASVCGGPEHILEDGKDGVLFSKGDRKASKKAMEQLLDGIGNFDPQELHDRIIAQYGRNEVRDRFLRFYEEVMKER